MTHIEIVKRDHCQPGQSYGKNLQYFYYYYIWRVFFQFVVDVKKEKKKKKMPVSAIHRSIVSQGIVSSSIERSH